MNRHSYCAISFALAFLAWTGCTARTSRAPAMQTGSDSTAGVPSWMPGVWTREWIQRRGVRSNSFTVHYLQTPSVYGDVRFPVDRRAFPPATSFADLTDDDLRHLARQRGFTGRTRVVGAISTWQHEVDFQPSDGSDDIGRVERVDDARMYEHALDSSYVESWRTISNGAGRFVVVRVDRAGRLDRTLIVVGDHFFYVRNRAKDLPAAPSLDSLIARTRATREQIVEYLDCEFSVGRVRGGRIAWEVERSTLPWREGQHLEFADVISTSNDASGLVVRVASPDRWSVPVNTLTKSDLAALFPPRG